MYMYSPFGVVERGRGRHVELGGGGAGVGEPAPLAVLQPCVTLRFCFFCETAKFLESES